MKNKETEELIRETAKRMFFGEGRFHAKLHEIATEAGVNKALLHYYFRDRETLFSQVAREAMEESFLAMFGTLSGIDPFEKKVEDAVRQITFCLIRYPYIETFLVSEINASADPKKAFAIKQGADFTKKFSREINAYHREKGIKGISAENFLVNMMALCAYPASTKPVIKSILSLDEKAFEALYRKRIKMVTRLLLEV